MSNQFYQKHLEFDLFYTYNQESRIFGKNFVENNKDKCLIIYEDKEYELKEFFEEIDDNTNKNSLIEIKLKIIQDIKDMNNMFYECNNLLAVSVDIKLNKNPTLFETKENYSKNSLMSSSSEESQMNTLSKNETDNLYKKCDIISSSMSSIPINITSDLINTNYISPINDAKSSPCIINPIDLSFMFCSCDSLLALPDLSKLNTSNVKSMNNMFYECSSSTSLPDLSKWNTSNVESMNNMFFGCKSLTSLPDLSKWNTVNVTNMSNMFNRCNSLLSLPDLSKWNTSNVTNMYYIFSGCNS